VRWGVIRGAGRGPSARRPGDGIAWHDEDDARPKKWVLICTGIVSIPSDEDTMRRPLAGAVDAWLPTWFIRSSFLAQGVGEFGRNQVRVIGKEGFGQVSGGERVVEEPPGPEPDESPAGDWGGVVSPPEEPPRGG